MRRYLMPALFLLIPGYFAMSRVDNALECLARSNAELAKANAQLSTANRQIAHMEERLVETSKKLDEANANIALTNNRFVALDQVVQKFTLWRK